MVEVVRQKSLQRMEQHLPRIANREKRLCKRSFGKWEF